MIHFFYIYVAVLGVQMSSLRVSVLGIELSAVMIDRAFAYHYAYRSSYRTTLPFVFYNLQTLKMSSVTLVKSNAKALMTI